MNKISHRQQTPTGELIRFVAYESPRGVPREISFAADHRDVVNMRLLSSMFHDHPVGVVLSRRWRYDGRDYFGHRPLHPDHHDESLVDADEP
jgi:hypothetical protein